jgi:hypothetical protein
MGWAETPDQAMAIIFNIVFECIQAGFGLDPIAQGQVETKD